MSASGVAYCGSTNTAYGDATAATRCAADILCTDFMAAVMKRASTGRALLQARQAFVKSEAVDVMDPVDQKTLGQFLLLGDPSLRPFGAGMAPEKAIGLSKSIVAAAAPGGMKRGGAKSMAKAKVLAPAAHKALRAGLKTQGAVLARTTATAQKVAGSPPAAVRDSLEKLMRSVGLQPGRSMRYAVVSPTGARAQPKSMGAKSLLRGGRAMVRGMKSVKGAGAQGEAVHVMLARVANGAGAPKAKGLRRRAHARVRPKIPTIRGVVARTRGGQVVSYKPVWSK